MSDVARHSPHCRVLCPCTVWCCMRRRDENFCYDCDYNVAVLCLATEPQAGVDDTCTYALTKSTAASVTRLLPQTAQVCFAVAWLVWWARGLIAYRFRACFAPQVARIPRGQYAYFTFPAPQEQASFTITAITSGAVRGYLTNGYARVDCACARQWRAPPLLRWPYSGNRYHRASATQAQMGTLPTSSAHFWSTDDPANVNTAHGAVHCDARGRSERADTLRVHCRHAHCPCW